MTAFAKELAGLLCSDHQAWRVMENKIMPEIIDTLTNRASNDGGREHPIWALSFLEGAIQDYALSSFTQEVSNGLIHDATFELYDFLCDGYKQNALEMLDDNIEAERISGFTKGYADWKAKNS